MDSANYAVATARSSVERLDVQRGLKMADLERFLRLASLSLRVHSMSPTPNHTNRKENLMGDS